jgi:hypothetical protein
MLGHAVLEVIIILEVVKTAVAKEAGESGANRVLAELPGLK